MSDSEWLAFLIQGMTTRIVRGIRMPEFPDENIQHLMVGSAGEHSLREAFLFWQECKAYCQRFAAHGLDQSRILDFGSGWGRYVRFFLKDTPPAQLLGVDIDQEFVDLSKRLLPGVDFSLIAPLPPTQLPTAHFDLIYAYSVFSHLSEAAHQAWVSEFARILRPGGLVFLTTQGRHFIDFCASLRQQSVHESNWHRALASSFIDTEQAKRDYDHGCFLYAGTGGGGPRDKSFYGEAVVPPDYVKRTWIDRFRLIDFVDDTRRCPQAIIVARRIGT